MQKNKLSIVIPVYNEAPALPLLHEALCSVCASFPKTEVLYIDDGSTDGSAEALRTIAKNDPHAKIIVFGRNYGQTAAIRAGIEQATGDIIIPMDSDLENDPHDIPLLVQKLEEGYDVVSGWRQDRWHDSFFTRKLPSLFANWLISSVTGVHLHDYGCTLKAYRRSVIAGVPLYGEMHRFIPAHAARHGAKVTEVPVHYRPRPFGRTNYGLSRTFRVLLDLLIIRFLDRYMDRPIHFFGGIGFLLFFLGILAGLSAVALRLFIGLHLVQTPLPLLSVFLILMGINMIMMGVLSEMLMRTYYETKDTKPYRIKETVNL